MLSKACFLLPLALAGAATSPIKHVIVLMEENRSFDHLLGHLKAIDPRVNGLDASSGNPLNPLDPHSQFIPVNYNPVDGGSIDPCHAFDCATQQIYGYEKPMANKSAVPRMNGFAANTPGGLHNVPYVLSAFNNTNLPILSTLAQEFAVFDAWHCSAPTCTNPNREFMMSGTAHGMIDNTFPGPGFPQETFFNMIERRANLTWKIYYGDNTWMAPAFADLRSPQHVSLVQQYEQFFYDLGNGTLPAFSLIQPRTATGPGGISNWQHPDNSVEAGEALIARVYTALKASQYWDSAALAITYDENGGCA
jgi:phospholipase C